jgi:hypothetical protein
MGHASRRSADAGPEGMSSVGTYPAGAHKANFEQQSRPFAAARDTPISPSPADPVVPPGHAVPALGALPPQSAEPAFPPPLL